MKEMTEKDALFKLTALCSQAEHCTYEMLEKMRRWEIADDAQARIMEYLVREKYVDDERYCRLFVKDKIRYNKWGRRKVEQALMQKRISRDIYQPVLDEVDDEEYLTILKPLLQNKRRQLKAMSEYEANGRLIRFAISRGFTMDIIRQCINDTDDYTEDGE
jgi:regulatory protein